MSWGTLSDGAAGGKDCHAERSEASLGPARATLRYRSGRQTMQLRMTIEGPISFVTCHYCARLGRRSVYQGAMNCAPTF